MITREQLQAAVAEAPREEIPALVGILAAAHAEALARLMSAPSASVAGNVELLTVQDAAERLTVKPSHVYDQIRRGELPSVRVGKYVRVPAAALAEHMRRRTCGRGYTAAGS